MSYFDHFANSPGTPAGNWIKQRSRQAIFSIISSSLPGRDAPILEIGPGMGELAESFLSAGYHNYTAVEPNRTLREKLETQGLRVKNYLIPRLEEADCSYAAILLVDVFEHLNDAREASEFICEARRVLKPGGILCIHSPDYRHWKEDFFNGDYSHNYITTARRCMQLFHNHGLQTLKVVYFSGFLTGTLATLTSSLARIGLFFLNGNAIDSKLYKIKLTFLRQFLVIGKKRPD
jgi:SAM-dependent methyltransferase